MDDLIKKINKFRDDRNWRQFHNEKDLAISISIEASELLELFQWKTSDVAVKKNIAHIKEELADVMIYSIMLADNLNLDIEEIIIDKLTQNATKYPVEKSYGSNLKYTEFKNNEEN